MPKIEIGKQKPFVVLAALHILSACLILGNELLAINNRVPGGNFPIEHRYSWARVMLFCGVAAVSVIVVWISVTRKDINIFLPTLPSVLLIATLVTFLSVLYNYPAASGWCCEVFPTRYFGFPFSYSSGDNFVDALSIPSGARIIQYRFPYRLLLDLLFWSSLAFILLSSVPVLIQKVKDVLMNEKKAFLERPIIDRMIRLFLAIVFGLIAGLVVFFSPARTLETSAPAAISSMATPISTPTLMLASYERMFKLVFVDGTRAPKLSPTNMPTTIAEADCPGAQPVGVTTGQIAMLHLDPSILGRVHEQPGLQSTVLGQLRSDEFFIILAGPQCADDLIWWKVQSARGLLGWIAEGYVSSYWLVTPTPVDTKPTDAPTLADLVPTPAPTTVSGTELMRVLKGHTDTPETVAWSPDSTRLASGGRDYTFRIWDWAQNQQLFTVTFPGQRVYSVDWSPDGTRVALGSMHYLAGGPVEPEMVPEVRSGSNGELLLKMNPGNGRQCRKMKWSPNGLLLAGGCEFGNIFLWDALTGEPLRILEGHKLSVDDIAWSPSGRYIASSSNDGTLRVFEVISGEQMSLFTNEVPGCHMFASDQIACGIAAIAWSPDGNQIAFGSNNSAIKVWNPVSGEIRTIGYQREVDDISAVVWSPDGKRLASTAGLGGTIRIWNLTDEQHPSMLALPDVYQATGAAWSPDGKYLAVTGSPLENHNEGLIWIWRVY